MNATDADSTTAAEGWWSHIWFVAVLGGPLVTSFCFMLKHVIPAPTGFGQQNNWTVGDYAFFYGPIIAMGIATFVGWDAVLKERANTRGGRAIMLVVTPILVVFMTAIYLVCTAVMLSLLGFNRYA
ncbi:hypothetical protein [Stratiformator vulcanicus]|uniref:Uncharacterized protein n=1 Tax=Stratiformator vulcanicus TaxID=2527980 RepID=A0A517R666_9PLAN|nr:hypothetical protein [Stratiformator vulcanicus]QDT39360.1 hypothetical protein Pan189_37660 [Stratiformator vulcanicus]